MSNPRLQRAVISVSDKAGLAEFAQGLAAAGVEIYSTGGTRKFLEQAGLKVRDVAEYTGFPEMLDGRVKTLHPKIFGGILARRDHAEDMQLTAEHGIVSFELVVVNLYPFEATVAKPNVSVEDAIENIDIGGPSLVRAAAKNHAFVTIATSPSQYEAILQEVKDQGATSFALRRKLAAAAYAHTAGYDAAISAWFAKQLGDTFPQQLSIPLVLENELRYGENSHQLAAVYRQAGANGTSLVRAKQLNGKELSYNNLLDLDSALAIVRPLSQAACAVIKHNNPCGAAVGDTLAAATRKALEGDPQSAFGGVLAMNQTIDQATAEVLCQPGLFLEAIVAPAFDAAALDMLKSKPKWKANVRLLAVGDFTPQQPTIGYRQIEGGMLVQQADVLADPESEWKIVTEKQPDARALAELKFAWAVVRHVKSNAISLSKDGMLIGCGAGQMSRVDSVEIAIQKAGQRAPGSVLASDAFFPFPDSIHRAAAAGVIGIIQPGGSVKDPEVIAACNEHGLPMIFTGRRHFKH
ncbi:bifunctional phosphoribosylaminoimidazolecarboxamide formyltransferase/IMP cyclohydrolase [Anatilimnocola floriformis]|uniref:bifunctional phosphoribosylaminoimidazolecarboxamide formyltransferase/IMP cyclohydrolase n=1 Tax=Anatilimnocola floriformis TaxID=2948575 RepID=UPI0020C31F7F|nr:bifunctional phosphoribosylaminoimidazolecarboxamide formyltransferase/IMP cyclohydrolase [Anatilimnocola floriformis]